MIYEINNTVVPKLAYNDVSAIRRSGGRCHLMELDPFYTHNNPAVCPNCDGSGEIVIEKIIGGPSSTPIRAEVGSGEATTWIDDNWYKRRLNAYKCTVCNNTGRVPVREA